jgi:hypothetical protein
MPPVLHAAQHDNCDCMIPLFNLEWMCFVNLQMSALLRRLGWRSLRENLHEPCKEVETMPTSNTTCHACQLVAGRTATSQMSNEPLHLQGPICMSRIVPFDGYPPSRDGPSARFPIRAMTSISRPFLTLSHMSHPILLLVGTDSHIAPWLLLSLPQSRIKATDPLPWLSGELIVLQLMIS